MKIDLPNITIQDDWTIPGQVKKIGEEYSEVAEAVALANPIDTIREALDTMQTCCTLISMVQAEYNLDMGRFLREHNEKLERKGYLGFTPEDDKPIPYMPVDEPAPPLKMNYDQAVNQLTLSFIFDIYDSDLAPVDKLGLIAKQIKVWEEL